MIEMWMRRLGCIGGMVVACVSPVAMAQSPLPPCVVAQSTEQPSGKPAAKPGPSDAPQFYDEPQFTVAGVKDPSETGGHGSDTVRRTTEALTKETVGLGGDGVQAAVPEVSGTAAGEPAGNGPAGSELAMKDEAALRARVERDPANPEWHRALADVEEKRGNSLAAVQEYQRAAEISPSEVNLFDWGSELLLHRAYEPAREVFARGRRLFPASVRMAMGLGVAAYALGSYDLAAQRFCEASDIEPTDEKPYLFLGKLQAVGSGLVPGVVERLERFERLHPHNAWASYYRALAVWNRREGHPDAVAQVEQLLRNAIGKDAKLAAGYLQLGIVYAEQKNWANSAGWLERAVKLDPEMEEGHFRLATAYRMLGDTDKSKAELEVYQRIAKKNDDLAERSRREVAQFVYSSRAAPGSGDKR